LYSLFMSRSKVSSFATCSAPFQSHESLWLSRSPARGREVRPLELEQASELQMKPGTDLVALDDALKTLAALEPRKSQQEKVQRTAFLKQACEGDEELRRELESLLAPNGFHEYRAWPRFAPEARSVANGDHAIACLNKTVRNSPYHK
jgi:hypothetical protein